MLIETLRKIRDRKKQLIVDEQSERCENFAGFMNTKFYPEFKRMVRDKAMKTGLDAKTGDETLTANGKRQAYVEILEWLERQEKFAAEILT